MQRSVVHDISRCLFMLTSNLLLSSIFLALSYYKVMEKTDNSTATTSTDNLPGRVYFIRHGESTSNERNIFAGILDVGLTAFGRLQARRAGLDIQKKGVKFDAVYVSHMRRARQTCEIALD